MGKKTPLTVYCPEVFPHGIRNGALVGLNETLDLQTGARCAEASLVHGLLERVALPAKDVVAVLPEPGSVACAQYKRLRAVHGPLPRVVEARCVPDNLPGLLSARLMRVLKGQQIRKATQKRAMRQERVAGRLKLRTSNMSCGILTG